MLALAAALHFPVHFEPNRGQAPVPAAFVARNAGQFPLLLSPNRLVVPGIELSLLNANPRAASQPGRRLPGQSHYLSGSDRSQWVTGVPQYASVRFRAIYPGIDILYYSRDGQIEYDLLVSPHADPARIRLRIDSIDPVKLLANGDLQLGPTATLHKPVAFQGKRHVDARFRLNGRELSFHLAPYDKSQPLTIDPVLTYSFAFGGPADSFRPRLAVDAQGNSYVAGTTAGLGFPLLSAFNTQPGPSYTLFLARFDPSGTLLSSTYIGPGYEVSAICLDALGNIYLSGGADQSGFPLVSPPEPPSAGDSTFLMKLPNAANAISVSRFISGFNWTIDAWRAAGNTLIVTRSATVARINAATLATVSTTPLQFPVFPQLVTTDAAGNIYGAGPAVAGQLSGTPGAFQQTNAGSADVFVTKLGADGTTVAWTTLLGGSELDQAFAIRADDAGAVYVLGITDSPNFPTTAGAPQTVHGGAYDTFLTKLCPNGTCVTYSTYLGGAQDEFASVMALSPTGQAIVGGTTRSSNYPVVQAVQPLGGNGATQQLYRASPTPTNIIAPVLTEPILSVHLSNANDLLWGGRQGLYRSTDGGANWTQILTGHIKTILRAPSDHQVVYAAMGGIVYRSVNSGASFTQTTMTGEGIGAVDALNVNRFWLAGPSGVNRYENDALTLLIPGGVSTLAASPTTSNLLYIGAFGGAVLRSTDGGSTRTTIPLPASFGTATSIALHPSNPAVFYVAGPGGLLRTNNTGASFTALPIDVVQTVVVAPSAPNTIYALKQGGRLYQSTNGGDSFSEITPAGLPTVTGVVAHPIDASAHFGIRSPIGDMFITRVNPAGTAFEFSTFLGGTHGESPYGIGLDTSGAIFVSGETRSTDFPQTPHSLPGYPAVSRITLSRIDPTTPPCQFSVSPVSLKLPGGPATARVNVVAPSGCAWNASSQSGWLTVSSQGTGTGAADVLATPNTGVTRTGSVTVAGQSITIEQAPQGCAYTVTPSPLPAQSSAGGNVALNIATATGCPWWTDPMPSWITPSATQGTGTGPLQLTLAPNTLATERSASLSIAGRKVDVMQDGLCTPLEATISRYRVAAAGGEVTINVTMHSSCEWTVGIPPVSVTALTPLAGTGAGTVRVRVEPNNLSGDVHHQILVSRPFRDGKQFIVSQAHYGAPTRKPRMITRNANGHFELYTYGSATPAILQGSFATSFASAQDNQGYVFLAALDSWGALSLAKYDSYSENWSAWRRFGGVFRGTPAIAAGLSQALLAIRDTYNACWTMTANWDLSVSNLRNNGGIFLIDPALAATPDLTRAYVIGKDGWNALYSLYLVGYTPAGPFTPMGGVVKNKPSVAMGSDGWAYVAVRDSWDGLWIARLNGTQLINWGFQGGVMSQDPLINNLDDGFLAVTVRDSGSALWSATIPESATPTPPVWTRFGGVVENFASGAHHSVLYMGARDPWNNLWWLRTSDNTWTFVNAGGRARGVPSVSP